MKLNQILAKTELQTSQIKGLLTDYINFFKTKQSAFKGELKRYTPVPGYTDVATNRVNKVVTTTVEEKLNFLKVNLTSKFNNLFTLEATNASGITAQLIVDGTSWGEFTSLELLRLKSMLTNPKLKEVIQNIPVRSDTKKWSKTGNQDYMDRNIYETDIINFEEKTTEKEEMVLVDPNIQTAISAGKDINYTPQTTIKTKQVVVGNGDFTEYSGEWTHIMRTNSLTKLETLKLAVIDALQRVNQSEAIESELNAEKVLNYIF